jgi:hypothetical protein
VLVIPNRVSDALGYARNNSECFVIVQDFSPEPMAKVEIFFVNKVSVAKKITKKGKFLIETCRKTPFRA